MFVNIEEIEKKEIFDGCWGQVIHARNMTLVYWHFRAGVNLPVHSHFHEQITTTISGTFELVVGNDKKTQSPNIVTLIPPGVPHSGKAITECHTLDIFYPVRAEVFVSVPFFAAFLIDGEYNQRNMEYGMTIDTPS